MEYVPFLYSTELFWLLRDTYPFCIRQCVKIPRCGCKFYFSFFLLSEKSQDCIPCLNPVKKFRLLRAACPVFLGQWNWNARRLDAFSTSLPEASALWAFSQHMKYAECPCPFSLSASQQSLLWCFLRTQREDRQKQPSWAAPRKAGDAKCKLYSLFTLVKKSWAKWISLSTELILA